MRPPLLACSMGDPAGIGPEILVTAAHSLASETDRAACLLIGDPEVFADCAARGNRAAPVEVNTVDRARQALDEGDFGPFVLPCAALSSPPQPGRSRPEDSAAALAAVALGARLASTREVDALVTAPLSKHGVAVHEPGFRGHTEYLAALDDGAHPVMLFAAPRPIVPPVPDIALLTTHLPLASAITMVRTETVVAALRRLRQTWAARFGRVPTLGVAALNPHAGEYGAIGGDEARILAPAIAMAVDDGIDARGPYPADSIFLHAELDVILTLYHDQGTIMAKRAPWPTVNLTLGLSYVRTSPDHGTAYDLAGRGRADPAPMLAAMRLAAQLAGDSSGPERSESRRD